MKGSTTQLYRIATKSASCANYKIAVPYLDEGLKGSSLSFPFFATFLFRDLYKNLASFEILIR